MAVNTPDTASQVEDRIKADVQREAPDSNPYLTVHWLRSLIAGIARRIFDFYRDLGRTETRLFPDTADEETAPRWGNIYVGPENPATAAEGVIVATGVAGGLVGIGETLTANGIEYLTTTAGVIADMVVPVSSITRSGATATVTTNSEHGLSTFVPVTIAGADQTEYNVTDAATVVTGLTTFEFQVVGTPVSPATGVITAAFTTANVSAQAVTFGNDTNLDADTAMKLQSPVVDVDDTMFVTFGALGGGTDEESTEDYKGRYLDKIRKPVAGFNDAAIIAEAKKVPGVTRVFVNRSGTEIGTVSITTLTRDGDVAKAVTSAPHGFEDGNRTTVNNADQPEYNVTNVAILVGDATTFYYVVAGAPTTPATGTISAATNIALGQVVTFFMRDNDDDPIPTASEVLDVKAQLDGISPANTSFSNNIVNAPTPIVTAYTFTELNPNTPTMRDAITANLEQFHEEEAEVSVTVTEEQYRAAIQNTIDPNSGDSITTFTLSAPSGDIDIEFGEIATLGVVTYP